MKIKNIAEGLTIIAGYEDGRLCVMHDEIHAGSDNVSDEDMARLKELGWIFEGEGWMCFT